MTFSTLLHMRIPFSYFLTPVFMFSLAMSRNIDLKKSILAFVIIHLLIYPASNGFNSFYDRDKGSIGGLLKPPEVTGDLLWFSILFDLAAVAIALTISWIFALGLFIYGLGSKSYSYDRIRLKNRPVISWLCVSLFGGALIFLLTSGAVSLDGYAGIMKPAIIIPAVISTFYLMASYPLTQVYQHEEDGARGDKTISLILGKRGTFFMSALFFAITFAGFISFLDISRGLHAALVFIVCQVPVITFFVYWFLRVLKDVKAADYRSLMIMNFISCTATDIFCVILLIFY